MLLDFEEGSFRKGICAPDLLAVLVRANEHVEGANPPHPSRELLWETTNCSDYASSLVNLLCIYSPRQLKAIGVLTSNKEGEVICEIDGLVLRGVQFRVLIFADWGVGASFED